MSKNYKDVSEEEILKAFNELWEDFPIKHHEWVAEDGTKCSSWQVGMLHTGDGGKELFDKAFKDLINGTT